MREIVIGGGDLGLGPVSEQGELIGSALPLPTSPPRMTHPAFEGIVGQVRLLERLERLAEGCAEQGTPLPPILLMGASGGGKTQIGHSIGRLVGARTCYTNCNRSLKLEGLLDILESAGPLDVAILDEVDKLGNDCQVALLSIVEGRQVRKPPSRGRHHLVDTVATVPPLSFVATTTRPGKMMPDLYNRFLVLDVDPYSASEMAEIATRVAESHGKTLELEGAMLLAGTCFGTPREVAKRTRELCLVERGFSLGRAEVREYLSSRGIHADGWVSFHHRILRLIGREGVSQARLESLTGLDKEVVKVYESQLVHAGLVAIERRGRSLTPAGILVLNELDGIQTQDSGDTTPTMDGSSAAAE